MASRQGKPRTDKIIATGRHDGSQHIAPCKRWWPCRQARSRAEFMLLAVCCVGDEGRLGAVQGCSDIGSNLGQWRSRWILRGRQYAPLIGHKALGT